MSASAAASLSFPARRDLDAVHEMQVEIGVGTEGEQVVVILGGSGRGDGDVDGLRPAGREQLARPAHGLLRLVVGRGGAHGVRLPGDFASSRTISTASPSSQSGTGRGPAFQRTGT